jgi:predicted nucleic acid-binding protein
LRFFVDANVVVYSAVACPHQQACREILRAVANGTAEGGMSTAALEEVWHLELSGRIGQVAGLTRNAYGIFAPLLPVTDSAFLHALGLSGAQIGPNDRLHVGTCSVHGIGVICSADAGFDSVPGLRRVDPLDQEARGRMLS